MKNDGINFEKETGRYYNQFFNDQLIHDHKKLLKTQNHSSNRQFDLYHISPSGDTAIECKDWKSTLRISTEIEEFHGKTSLFPETKNRIFISTSDYENLAKATAEATNISLIKTDYESAVNVILSDRNVSIGFTNYLLGLTKPITLGNINRGDKPFLEKHLIENTLKNLLLFSNYYNVEAVKLLNEKGNLFKYGDSIACTCELEFINTQYSITTDTYYDKVILNLSLKSDTSISLEPHNHRIRIDKDVLKNTQKIFFDFTLD